MSHAERSAYTGRAPLLSAALIAVALLGARPAIAAPSDSTEISRSQTLTAAARQSALEAIQTRLRKSYLYPDLVPKILAKLQASQARYATSDPALFASRITEDMQAVSKDTHLYLNFEPSWYQASLASPDAAQVAAENAFEIEDARNFNHGLTEMRILPGNIRYLKVDGFAWIGSESATAYDAAMRFLKDGSAIIIDLRSNGGGETEASNYLLSHFFAPDALMLTVISPGQGNQEVRSQKQLPAGRLKDVPLFVLTNGRTRSAAEAVAYTIQQFRLGEIVGERTQGAAHISDDTAIAPFFRLSVPISYTVNPVSNADWEGVGVTPTVAAESAMALDTAYDLALARLLRTTTNSEKRNFLLWAQQGLTAHRTGAPPTKEALFRLTGRYGSASLEFQDGALTLVRAGRKPVKLMPMGSDGLFESDEDDTLRVKISKRALDVLRPVPSMNEHYADDFSTD